MKTHTQNGSEFSSSLRDEWKNIKPGSSITFDNIKVKNADGKIIQIKKAPYFVIL